jgi:hypothetical protein
MIRRIEPTKCVILISDGNARRSLNSSFDVKRPEYMFFTDSIINPESINLGGEPERSWCFETGIPQDIFPTLEEAIMTLKMSCDLGETVEIYKFPPYLDEFEVLHKKLQRFHSTGYFKYCVDPEYLESLGFIKVG